MLESIGIYALLCLAALLGGMVNALAGGGTLLTFPALTAFVSVVAANATSKVALVPGSLGGAWGYRSELEGTREWFVLLVPPSVLGGIVGALLLTRLPERYFEAVIPWLLLAASVLFLLQPVVRRRFASPEQEIPWPASIGRKIGLVVFQFVIAVYGGYFGAGIGILMLTSLGFMGVGDIHRMNGIKTVLAACVNGTSVVIYVVEAKVDWRYAPAMALAALAGGYAGANVGLRLPKSLVRWIVVALGVGLSIRYFLRT